MPLQNRNNAAAFRRRGFYAAKSYRVGGLGQLQTGGQNITHPADAVSDRAGGNLIWPRGDTVRFRAALPQPRLGTVIRGVHHVADMRGGTVIREIKDQCIFKLARLFEGGDELADIFVDLLHHRRMQCIFKLKLLFSFSRNCPPRSKLESEGGIFGEQLFADDSRRPVGFNFTKVIVATHIFINQVLRCLQGEVRCTVRHIQEVGLIARVIRLLDHANGAVSDAVGCIISRSCFAVIGCIRVCFALLFALFPETIHRVGARNRKLSCGLIPIHDTVLPTIIFRIKEVRLATHQAEILIKPALGRQGIIFVLHRLFGQLAIRMPMSFPVPLRILVGFDVVGATEVPLADHQGFISGIAHQLRDGGNGIGQNPEITRIINRGVSAERSGTKAYIGGIVPRHQGRTRRAATPFIIEVFEAHSLLGKRIEVGGINFPAITTQIRIPRIIGHDDNNIGARGKQIETTKTGNQSRYFITI